MDVLHGDDRFLRDVLSRIIHKDIELPMRAELLENIEIAYDVWRIAKLLSPIRPAGGSRRAAVPDHALADKPGCRLLACLCTHRKTAEIKTSMTAAGYLNGHACT